MINYITIDISNYIDILIVYISSFIKHIPLSRRIHTNTHERILHSYITRSYVYIYIYVYKHRTICKQNQHTHKYTLTRTYTHAHTHAHTHTHTHTHTHSIRATAITTCLYTRDDIVYM